jgi:hypothetical protein
VAGWLRTHRTVRTAASRARTCVLPFRCDGRSMSAVSGT